MIVEPYAAAALRADASGLAASAPTAQAAQTEVVEQTPAAAHLLVPRIPRDDLVFEVVHGRLKEQIVSGDPDRRK